MKTKYLWLAHFTLLALFILTSCRHSSDPVTDSSDAGGGTGCPATAGQTATSTYTISWDAVSDSDLAGYRIYYGVTAPLTKSTALGFIDTDATMASAQFAPADRNITACSTAYFGVTTRGNAKAESSLSEIQTCVVE